MIGELKECDERVLKKEERRGSMNTSLFIKVLQTFKNVFT
jgi:hypothetical protein